MNARGWMMLRIFINRYNSKAGEALLKFLPQEEKQAVLSQDIRSTNLEPLLYQPQKLMEIMHYSWIKPLLDKFPVRLHPIVAASLGSEQLSGLSLLESSVPLAAPIKMFMLNQLYALLKADERLPLDYLPETELSPLAKWPKSKIVMLIDFLGLHDLASEVRHIVNKEHLKNIYNCLSPKQLYYLKICLHQKDLLIVPKLGIDPSRSDCTKLNQLLHRRGLLRLGKAFCGQHPDLVWYVAHILDIGRGKIVLETYHSEIIPKITPFLKTQVVSLMNLLKTSRL